MRRRYFSVKVRVKRGARKEAPAKEEPKADAAEDAVSAEPLLKKYHLAPTDDYKGPIREESFWSLMATR